MRLRALAPGKVNLCLFLGAPRKSDGRHQLVTLFESVSLADELTLTTLDAAADPSRRDEVRCPGVPGPNLVATALAELRARGWSAPPVRIEIDKRIPVAAGMGGGSADAAATLRMAVELAPGRPEEIAAIAAGLGADVPAQLAPGLALGTGAGELVEPQLPLAEHALVIVPHSEPLSTAEVYRESDRLGLPRADGELREREAAVRRALSCGTTLPAELLVNDLEPATLSLCPAVGEKLSVLREGRADAVFVCGSGPTVAGLYWGAGALGRAAEAAAALAGRFPGARAVRPAGAEDGSPVFAG